MRWDEQRVERDLRLPGVGDGSVVRTFDAPEAMGINFHEVRARSALNRVPGGRYCCSAGRSTRIGRCPHACAPPFLRRPQATFELHAALGLRAGDRGQGERAGAATGRAGAAELETGPWSRWGRNTDPYQWVESRYRMMPEILAGAGGGGDPRLGADQVAAGAARHRAPTNGCRGAFPVSVNLSVPTLDEKAWGPRAPHPQPQCPPRRGRRAAPPRYPLPGVLIAPLMPGINDTPEQVPADRRPSPRGAGRPSSVASPSTSETRSAMSSSLWLQAKRPDLIPRYEMLYADGRAYLRQPERSRLTSVVPRLGQGPGEACGRGRGGRVGGNPGRRHLSPRQGPPGQERQDRLF